MLGTLISAWKITDLRKKLIFTLAMFLIFRLGAHVPVPGIDVERMAELIRGGALLGFLDVISGGSLQRFAIFAMGIMPYINASIIMNLLTVVIPALEKLAKEGEEGRKKIAQFTRYGTIILAVIQATGMALFLARTSPPILLDASALSIVITVITLTAGTAFLMWLGELITERGIGNGISLIIFAGIVAGLPGALTTLYQYLLAGTINIFAALIFGVLGLLLIAAVVAIAEGQRRIPVQYAKRVVGRKVYGGQSTHIPLKVNQAGVIPVIFAMSILLFPSTIAAWYPANWFAQWITRIFDGISFPYMFMYGVLIIFFTYFYTAITFNPQDVAENMKKYGGFIPGYRPGRPTAEFIERVLSRITIAGAVFLAFIALLPLLFSRLTGLPIGFGGTGLLIVVGVALETMKQMEAQMLMRHYQGFMKK